jgi:hypothetical protein
MPIVCISNLLAFDDVRTVCMYVGQVGGALVVLTEQEELLSHTSTFVCAVN